MFVTKKHIPRRTFLRGCGVTLALPFLESMLPAQTPLRQTVASPGSVRRFVGIWHPHGAAPGYWSPLQEGSSFEFSFITKPLEPLRDRVVLITGLDATGSSPTADEPGGDHARGANLLSGARPRRDSVSPYLGVTIDQMIANKWGKDTLLPSIQLGIEDPDNNTGNYNWNYSCAYSNSISWPTPTTPLPTEINPRMVFERLFGDGASADERVIDRKRTGSILDSVTHEIASFKKGIPAGDRAKLDTYLENVREIGVELGTIARGNTFFETCDLVSNGIEDTSGPLPVYNAFIRTRAITKQPFEDHTRIDFCRKRCRRRRP